MKCKRKELLLTYAKSNQVRDFHVPPNHTLSLTKLFFHPITLMPYFKHECGTQDKNTRASRRLNQLHPRAPVIPPKLVKRSHKKTNK